ncbi:VWA domain-containing protein [bacterium]|nr:VWA domain-containing protein [bacterium]
MIVLYLSIHWSASGDVEVDVTRVSVWLKAVDGAGAPVRSLNASDFEIYENGKRVETTCFEEIVLENDQESNATEAEVAQSGDINGKFTLFLDLYNTSPSEFEFIRPQIKDFLKQIDGRSEVMVIALVPPGKLGIVAQYTSDISKISRVVDQAKGNPNRDPDDKGNEAKIIGLLQDVLPEDNPPDSVEDLTRIDPKTELNNQLFNNAFQMAHSFMMQDIRRAEISLKAFESIGNYLASKHQGEHASIIYLSGGFSSDPGRRYYDLINEFANKLGFNRDQFVYSLRFPKSKKTERFDIYKLIQEEIGRLNRVNITVYAVNTRGMALSRDNTAQLNYLAPDQARTISDFQDPLISIANETGGLSFHNSQNFKVGFDSILQDLQHQYVLCYQPPQHKKKDKYYEIKVTCKKPGVKLRHRQGYVD